MKIEGEVRRYVHWGSLVRFRPGIWGWSRESHIFVVLDRLSKLMIVYSKRESKSFDPDRGLTARCKFIIPVVSVDLQIRMDLDNSKKQRFYFSISNTAGRRKPLYIFGSETNVERDRWAERILHLSNIAVELDSLQIHNEVLRRKLFSATMLLKTNVGDKLLENMLSGRYRAGHRKYREVQEHLNDYFEVWERVMGQKMELHREMFAKKDKEVTEYVDKNTFKSSLLNKAIMTSQHVRRNSVNVAAFKAEAQQNMVEKYQKYQVKDPTHSKKLRSTIVNSDKLRTVGDRSEKRGEKTRHDSHYLGL